MTLSVLAVAASAASAAAPEWLSYRHDAAGTGIDPDSPAAAAVTPTQAWQTPQLDGAVYGQPLVYGSAVFVATENDTIYKLNSSTGAVIWSTHVATPQPSSAAQCGNITPNVGITSTPVIDPTTNRIYAVGAVTKPTGPPRDVRGGPDHRAGGVGLPGERRPADAAKRRCCEPTPAHRADAHRRPDPDRLWRQLRRLRHLLGLAGVRAGEREGGSTAFQVNAGFAPGQGAISGGGSAPTVDAAGNVYLATGNGSTANTGIDPQFGDAVVQLNASATALDWWAPTNWQSENVADQDLGSSNPTLLPGGFLFESGKDRNAYLLNGAALGHVSAPVEATDRVLLWRE